MDYQENLSFSYNDVNFCVKVFSVCFYLINDSSDIQVSLTQNLGIIEFSNKENFYHKTFDKSRKQPSQILTLLLLN